MYEFHPRAAYRLLRLARPIVTPRLAAQIQPLLAGVTAGVIHSFLLAKPRASALYVGTFDNGKRGIVLKIDRVGRVNAEWVEIPSVIAAYEQSNDVWAVSAVARPGSVEAELAAAELAAAEQLQKMAPALV